MNRPLTRNDEITTGLPDDKPVSVHASLRERRRQPFIWAEDLSPALATYPELVTERAAPRPLFGLAPHGVCPASGIAAAAVRSYRTFSPLPASCPAGGIFSVALSVKPALSEPPRPLAGMLPYGDRTFLPPTRFPRRTSGCLSGRPVPIMGLSAIGGQLGPSIRPAVTPSKCLSPYRSRLNMSKQTRRHMPLYLWVVVF